MKPSPFARAASLGKLAWLALAGYAAWLVLPMLWVLSGSLKESRAIFREPLSLPDPSNPAWDNYLRAWSEGGFGAHFLNSVLLTAGATLIVTLLGAMAAHALARFGHRASGPVFWLFLVGLVLPAQAAAVPLFFLMRDMGLLGTRTGLLLVYCANGLPFAIFVLAPFFRQLPRSLEEAAVIDGCGPWAVFWRVMLPLTKPGLATVAVFQALGIWKEYFLAFMLLTGVGPEAPKTLPLALGNLAITATYRSDPGMLFAGIVITSLPILLTYLVLQRQIVSGLTQGAVKG